MYLADRLEGLLSIGFQPKMSPREHAALLKEFFTALEGYPIRILRRACDSWSQQMNRAPTPAELRMRAETALAPEREAAEHEHRMRTLKAEDEREASKERTPEEQERALYISERLMRDAGFTSERADLIKRFPMARTAEEAEAMASEPSAFRTGPTPEELKALRDGNEIVQQARAPQARGQK